MILIGDAPPNTREQVLNKRKLRDWRKSPNFSKSTYYEDEIDKLADRKIPVHAYYVANYAKTVF